ncbi:MAG: ABC transporter substrate-binding protein [Rhodospirillales bacterium]|nr:ABC transporter substrate-binding protein [Rhodospirillales bacterium]
MKRFGALISFVALAFTAVYLSSNGAAEAATKMKMVVFGPPSLGAFLPPVIEEKKLDEKNGLDIEFVVRPPSAYNAQFNSGEFKLGGSAALLSLANAKTRGVNVVYLFNIFDYFGVVVTDKPNIKTLKDLEGKTMAAATATTNYVMFRWLAGKQGVDTSKINVVNTAPPGLIGYMLAGRADAVQMWEPAYTVLNSKKAGLHILDLKIKSQWSSFASSSRIPYLGVAAHADWAKENSAHIPALVQTYKDAAAWILGNPDAAAKIIAARIKGGDAGVIAGLIGNKERLALEVVPSSQLKTEINAVFKAGIDLGYLKKLPDASIIYSK